MESQFGHAVLESKLSGILSATASTSSSNYTFVLKFEITPICPLMASTPIYNHLEFAPAFQVVFIKFTFYAIESS